MNHLQAQGLGVVLGGRPVIAGLDLTFERGMITAIVGPNGAGKSTLLSCLCGLRRPAQGRVMLEDQPVALLKARDRARRLAYLEQTPEIAWAVDVRTLVGLGRTPFTGARGLSADDRAAVDAALDRTGMTAFADRLVTTLSGGERARVLIARALAGEPVWLLADEPLTGLDIGHQFDTLALFRRLADEGCGVVLTLHDLAAAVRSADRIVVLADGKVLADAAATDALSPDVLAQAYGVETRVVAGETGPLIEVLGRR